MSDQTFLQALWKRQAEAGLNDQQLADAMGVTGATISRLKGGSRRVGAKVIRGAVRRFPDLSCLLVVETTPHRQEAGTVAKGPPA